MGTADPPMDPGGHAWVGLGALSWAWLGVMPRTLQTRRGGEPGVPRFPLMLCLLPPE